MKVRVKLRDFEEIVVLERKPRSINDLADMVTSELARKYAKKLSGGDREKEKRLFWSYYDSHYDVIYQLLIDHLEKRKEELKKWTRAK